MRSIVVSCSTNILVNVLTALIAFRLLVQLGFSVKESVSGVLAFMLCTTHLHYTQNMMENNYIGLLTLVGFSYQYEWLQTNSRRALLIGSGALGLNLLTRLTTGLDLIAAGAFLLLALWFEPTSLESADKRGRARLLWRRSSTIAKWLRRFIYSSWRLIASTSFIASDRLPILMLRCSPKNFASAI